jgi:threonine/homoserine/homoserine lactone efflux protein
MLYKGLLIGFVGAATIGPIGFIIIQRTISRGKAIGFASGIGVALADAIFGLIGSLGLTLITELLIGNQYYLRLFGGFTLLWLGFKSLITKSIISQNVEENVSTGSLFTAMGTILLLTLSNPITILYFSAIYTGLLPNYDVSSIGVSLQFALGIFIGSYAWWVFLVGISEWLTDKLTLKNISWLNKTSGTLIAGFGIWILVNTLAY